MPNLPPLPPHPRTLLRKAVCALLRQSAFSGAVYANREEPWLAEELPVMGVYTTEESPLETDQSPPPDERRVTLVVDVLALSGLTLDDTLDAFSFLVEKAVTFAALEAKLRTVSTGLPLLDLQYSGTTLGLAEEGSRLIGVASLTFDLDYRMPVNMAGLVPFITAETAWDIVDYCGPDGKLEATDIVTLPQDLPNEGEEHA